MDGYQGQPIRQPVAMAYLCAGMLLNSIFLMPPWTWYWFSEQQ